MNIFERLATQSRAKSGDLRAVRKLLSLGGREGFQMRCWLARNVHPRLIQMAAFGDPLWMLNPPRILLPAWLGPFR